VAIRNGCLMRDDLAPEPRCRKLPALRNRVLGRSDAMNTVLGMLGMEGFVSVVGPGGVGKTAIAIAIAHSASRENMADVYFVDLSAVADDTRVPASVAAALGIPSTGEDVVPALLARLREHKHLLVLDNCEQVINGAARLTEQIRATAARTKLLVTSREPLLSGGERVFRLAPLAHPPLDAKLSAMQALNYPAIQLFAERAKERLGDYVLRDADTPAVMEICQRLEGLPLALELAAIRTEAFSARSIAAELCLGHEHLAWARRSTSHRHTTLAAAFDWSYDLLPAEAQQLLCTLAVFAHGFTLEAAQALCDGDHGLVAEGIAALVAKSFIWASTDAGGVRYHLFRHCRSCALRKLELSGRMAALQRRHATYLCRVLEAAVHDGAVTIWPDTESLHFPSAGDSSDALSWAFSAIGDPGLGVKLALANIPTWMRQLQFEECRRWVARALEAAPATVSA